MSMQQIMRWGHDFLRIRGGYLTFGPVGKSQMSKGEPIKNVNCPFLVFFPNHSFLPEIGWGSYCMGMGRVWEKIRIGQNTHYWKMCFDFMGKKTPKNICPFPHAFTFSSFLTFWGGVVGHFGLSILIKRGVFNFHDHSPTRWSFFPIRQM